MKSRNYKQSVLNRRKNNTCRCKVHVTAGGYRVTTKYCWKHQPVYEPMTAEALKSRMEDVIDVMRYNMVDVISAKEMDKDVMKEAIFGEDEKKSKFRIKLDKAMEKFKNK